MILITKELDFTVNWYMLQDITFQIEARIESLNWTLARHLSKIEQKLASIQNKIQSEIHSQLNRESIKIQLKEFFQAV